MNILIAFSVRGIAEFISEDEKLVSDGNPSEGI